MSPRQGAAPRAARPGTRRAEPVIDCLITRHPHAPRDRMGRPTTPSGRSLIIDASEVLDDATVTPRDLVRDRHLRWEVPALGTRLSVSHCGALAVVARSTGPHVGVDLQDERDRPGALRWLGALLDRPGPADLRDFGECEALIKASSLTKETFAGVRLPPRTPGWRPIDTHPYLVCSTTLASGTHLALVCARRARIRWWWRPSPTAPATRTEDPTTLDPR
ncbi:hypothetical protein AAH978_07555 [Streptomyces sp. ZYX-F-203]